MSDNGTEDEHGSKREKGAFEHLIDSINHSQIRNINNLAKISWVSSLILIEIIIVFYWILR